MRAKCLKCGFEGNVSDNLIPDTGRNINCPKGNKGVKSFVDTFKRYRSYLHLSSLRINPQY